jgi:hypothetical protein
MAGIVAPRPGARTRAAAQGRCWETWPMARLFVAVWPTPEVVALVADRSSPGTVRFEDLASFPLEG